MLELFYAHIQIVHVAEPFFYILPNRFIEGQVIGGVSNGIPPEAIIGIGKALERGAAKRPFIAVAPGKKSVKLMNCFLKLFTHPPHGPVVVNEFLELGARRGLPPMALNIRVSNALGPEPG